MTPVPGQTAPFDRFRSAGRLALGALAGVVLLATSARTALGGQPNRAATVRTVAEQGPVRVTVTLEPSPARLSDDLTLAVSIECAGGLVVRACDFAEIPEDFLVGQVRELPADTEGGRTVLGRVYVLEPVRLGRLVVPAVRVTAAGVQSTGEAEHVVRTGAIEVDVMAAVPPDAGLETLRPAAGPLAWPAEAAGVALWPYVGVAMGMAGLVLAWGWWMRRGAGGPIAGASPRHGARQELHRLLEAGWNGRDLKAFYVDLTRVVRRHLEETAGIHALEQTTQECLRAVAARRLLAPEAAGRLQSFLEAADLVKYGAYVPSPAEVDESIDRARSLVESPRAQGVGA